MDTIRRSGSHRNAAAADAIVKWRRPLRRTALLALLATTIAGCASPHVRDGDAAAARYDATITRTSFGIPHIRAADFGSLGFGAAYVRAQDNVCLLAEAYVSDAGQRTKYFGADGMTLVGIRPARNIDSDVFYLTTLDPVVLQAAFEQRSADYRALVDGWVAGYNRYLRDHRDDLPSPCADQSWVREITRDDVLRSVAGFSLMSSSAMFAGPLANAAPPGDTTVGRASLPLPQDDHRDTASLGSNGWAFGGAATKNGRGLVMANPHMPWIGPTRFYESHYTIPGQLDVAGAAIMTLPYIGIGFNRDVAWTHTVDMAAHMTLYRLALDPADPTVYRIDGEREPMTQRDIRVENMDGTTITRTVFISRYGPVVSMPGTDYAWTRQTAYAVADANTANLRSGDSWLDMARAHDVEGIREALARHLGSPTFNTLAADRSGSALYADISAIPNVSAERFADCGTVVPRLPGHLQDLYVLDGSRSACAWETTGDAVAPQLLPSAQMATIYRHDYVQNSNDSYRWSNPAAVMQLSPIMGRDPGLGGLRTRAALEDISRVLASGKFDPELAAQAMLSNRVIAADLALPALRKLCKHPKAAVDACRALVHWDGKADLDSRGAMLFSLFWSKIGTRPEIWKTAANPDDPLHTPRDLLINGKAGDDLRAALAAAADQMRAMGLAADAPLGSVQFAVRGEEHIPISGLPTGGVLNYVNERPVSGGFAVIMGSSYIQSVSFDEQGPVANAVLTYSQSTDPASPYFADQTREFSQRRLHRFPFSAAEIAADKIGAPLTIQQ